MKHQKWLLAYVLSCRNRLRCRAVLLIAFTDWYDPNKPCKYLGGHVEAYRKNFGTSQSCKAHLENSTFWLKFCVLALFYLENGYENWKIAISLRFELYKSIGMSCGPLVCFHGLLWSQTTFYIPWLTCGIPQKIFSDLSKLCDSLGKHYFLT